jgi:hypothetical protein
MRRPRKLCRYFSLLALYFQPKGCTLTSLILRQLNFVRGRCVDPVQSAKSAAVRRDYRAQGLTSSVLADYQAERRTTLGNPIDVGDQSPDFLGTSDLDKVLA